ncbi:hypothetical protein L9F63_015173 [Diploptera punctata]|uniref:Uncharacterized protein n=1 Tax=Diploptera punctata TaxID=6984 RepID=A0AAD8A6L9_DIPPU|nr:hypothetical protein L9F63_015173 [Diploptera punctata]
MDLQYRQSGQIVNWLNEEEEDEDVTEHESGNEADHLSESEHNSDTEQEATMSDEDYEDDAPLSQLVSYKCKDGTSWRKKCAISKC